MTAIVAFLRTIPLPVYMGAGLFLSLALNLHQFGQAQAADAECRAKLAEAQIAAKAQADAEQAKRQKAVDQSAVDDNYQDRETLAQIVAGVQTATNQLKRAANANPSPVVCRVSVERVRVVNAALSVPRTARPAL
jgi:hypothetical protein